MKNFKFVSKNILGSEVKVKNILQKIKGLTYLSALKILKTFNGHLSVKIYKTVTSAFYNFVAFLNEKSLNITIKEAYINKGSILKKLFPRAKGKTDIRKKHFSHLIIILEKI